MAEAELKKREQIITPIGTAMGELSKAIETAKRNTEFFTEDVIDVAEFLQPVEISIKNAEIILAYLQRRAENGKV